MTRGRSVPMGPKLSIFRGNAWERTLPGGLFLLVGPYEPQTKKKNRPDLSCAHPGSQQRALATAATGPSAERLAQRGWQEREISCYDQRTF
jgi:hypothetical protein